MSHADDYLDDRMHEEAARGSGSWMDPEQDEEEERPFHGKGCWTCSGKGYDWVRDKDGLYNTQPCPVCAVVREQERQQ